MNALAVQVSAEANFLIPGGVLVLFAILAVGLVLTGVWLWSLVDALRIDDRFWYSAGHSKILWVLVIVLLGILGSLLYVVMPRPALRRVMQPGAVAGVHA